MTHYAGWYLTVAGNALALGYLLGRARPWRQVRERAWWVIITADPTRTSRLKLLASLTIWPDRLAVSYWRRRTGRTKSRTTPAPALINRRKEDR